MIKYIIYTFALLSISLSTKAQIGINTENPLQILHVDPLGNNDKSVVNTKYNDDIVITSDGSVGIGTQTPTAKLDIRGGITINDGNQKVNYLWTSLGTDGSASWMPKVMNRHGAYTITASPSSITLSPNTVTRITGSQSLSTDNSVGLKLGTNSVIVSKGKYIVFMSGDISGSEFGNFIIKQSDGTLINTTFYTESLSGPSFILETTNSIELYLYYQHIQSGVAFYNSGPYKPTQMFFTLTFLRIK